VRSIADDYDLGALRLSSGQGRRNELSVSIEPLVLGEQRYAATPRHVPVVLDISRMTGHGYALRLRFVARLEGPCMRCLAQASPEVSVDAREVDRPGAGEELCSPYIEHELLDLSAWARDAFVLAAPAQVLCAVDCAGLCPDCAANLNLAGPDHRHEREPDPRWAKLRELRLE